VDLTFATPITASPRGECQIQNSTGIQYFPVRVLNLKFL
jgi:hypothetical protein